MRFHRYRRTTDWPVSRFVPAQQTVCPPLDFGVRQETCSSSLFCFLVMYQALPFFRRPHIPGRGNGGKRTAPGLRASVSARSDGILPAKVINSSANSVSSNSSSLANSRAMFLQNGLAGWLHPCVFNLAEVGEVDAHPLGQVALA